METRSIIEQFQEQNTENLIINVYEDSVDVTDSEDLYSFAKTIKLKKLKLLLDNLEIRELTIDIFESPNNEVKLALIDLVKNFNGNIVLVNILECESFTLEIINNLNTCNEIRADIDKNRDTKNIVDALCVQTYNRRIKRCIFNRIVPLSEILGEYYFEDVAFKVEEIDANHTMISMSE